jgi:endonuclease/exonuclease/phosphatase (EEP) superfamily protein YafD
VPTRRIARGLTTALAGVMALGAAVPTLARLVEPHLGTPVPQLAAFAPWAVPVWLLAGVLLLIGRSRRSRAVVVLMVGLILALGVRWQVPPTRARQAIVTETGTGLPLRVMTLNVMLGQGDAAAAFALVQRHQVDVLVVEELTPAFLARLRTAGIDRALTHADLHPHAHAAGTGIWSRWPLTPKGTIASAGFEIPMAMVSAPGGREVLVTGIHTRAPNAGNLTLWRQDLAALAAAARARPDGAQIWTGDFNASRDHSGFRAVLATGLVDAGDALRVAPWPGFTWPAEHPATRIDHVLLTPASIGVRRVSVVSLPGTDHHGVVADLVLKSGRAAG